MFARAELAKLKAVKQPNYTTIAVRYFNGNTNEYSYKAPLSWKLKTGDLVIVPTGNGFSLAIVMWVNKKPLFDVEFNYSYRWAAAKATEYMKLVELDKEFETNFNNSANA